MKKFTLLTTVVAVALSVFATSVIADVMPIILNCTFTVQGNILHVDVHNQDDWSRDFDLNEHEVTIERDEVDGSMSVSIHKEGTDYWQVSRMFDISMRQAIRLAPKVDAKMAYIKEVSPTKTKIIVEK
jgi:hypothetical protein